MKNKLNITYKDITIFLIPVILFFMYLFVYNPGVLTYDSFNQLNQISSKAYLNNHPFFHTFLELLLLKIYNNPIIIPIFQILVFSTIWTVICKYNRKDNSSKRYYLQLLLTLFIAINPINGIHAITLWKDVLYSYILMLLAFLIQVISDKKFILSIKDLLWLSFVLILTTNLRHNGLIITVIISAILLSVLYIKDKVSKNYQKFAILLLAFFFIFKMPNYFLGVKDYFKDRSLSMFDLKAFHLNALFLRENRVKENELNKLKEYADVDTLVENFKESFLDTIGKAKYNDSRLRKGKIDLYWSTVVNSLNNLDLVFKYLNDTTSIIFHLNPPKNSIGTTIYTGIDGNYGGYSYIEQINKDNKLLFYYNDIIYGINSKLALRTILYSPAFYFYLTLIISFILYKRKEVNIFFIILPNILNLLGLIISIPVQDVRYVYPNFLFLYLVLIILISKIKFKSNFNKSMDKLTIEQEYKKLLMIIPAYNEEENILKTYKSIKKYKKLEDDIEIDVIVINDGSRDNTQNILIENNIPHINLIKNLGIGGAVQTGYKYARDNNYDIAVQFDGDGQHDINYLHKLIKPIIKSKADMVIGSRFIDKDKSEFKSSFTRRIGINLISFVINLKTKKKIYDTTSGFRAVNKSIIQEFASDYPTEYPEPISSVKMLNKGYDIDEVAVAMKEREGGVSSITSWKTSYYMINVILSILISRKKGK